MLKLLIWIVIAWLAYTAWKNYTHRQRAAASPAPQEPEQMVACAHCGVYLPRAEVVQEAGSHYCSAEHAGLRRPR